MCVYKRNIQSTAVCVASGWFDIPLTQMYPTSFWAFAHLFRRSNAQYLSFFGKENFHLLLFICQKRQQLHGCQVWTSCYTWYSSCKSISIVIESLQSFHPSVFLFRAACNCNRATLYVEENVNMHHSFTSRKLSKNKENI